MYYLILPTVWYHRADTCFCFTVLIKPVLDIPSVCVRSPSLASSSWTTSVSYKYRQIQNTFRCLTHVVNYVLRFPVYCNVPCPHQGRDNGSLSISLTTHYNRYVARSSLQKVVSAFHCRIDTVHILSLSMPRMASL